MPGLEDFSEGSLGAGGGGGKGEDVEDVVGDGVGGNGIAVGSGTMACFLRVSILSL